MRGPNTGTGCSGACLTACAHWSEAGSHIVRHPTRLASSCRGARECRTDEAVSGTAWAKQARHGQSSTSVAASVSASAPRRRASSRLSAHQRRHRATCRSAPRVVAHGRTIQNSLFPRTPPRLGAHPASPGTRDGRVARVGRAHHGSVVLPAIAQRPDRAHDENSATVSSLKIWCRTMWSIHST